MSDSFFDFTRYDISDDELREVVTIEGDEQSDLLIFLHKSSFRTQEKEFLEKVISATKRKLSDSLIYILNDNQGIRTAQIGNFNSYRYIFSAGVSPKNLSINTSLNYYEPFQISNQKFLFVPSLTDISTDLEHKKKLWAALKVMFEIEKNY